MNKNFIVSAAMQINISEEKLIIPSVRHFDKLTHVLIPLVVEHLAVKYQLFTKEQIKLMVKTAEQGFVDKFGVFHNRQEAWKIAKDANQIFRNVGGDQSQGGTLYSENLY